MAKAKGASEIDPEAQYRVTLNRVVKRGSIVLRPRAETDIILKGRVVAELGDAVETYDQVQPISE